MAIEDNRVSLSVGVQGKGPRRGLGSFENDLYWFFLDARGDLGEQSNHASLIAACERGTVHSPSFTPWATMATFHTRLEAVKRQRRIGAAIRKLSPLHRAALRLVYDRADLTGPLHKQRFAEFGDKCLLAIHLHGDQEDLAALLDKARRNKTAPTAKRAKSTINKLTTECNRLWVEATTEYVRHFNALATQERSDRDARKAAFARSLGLV